MLIMFMKVQKGVNFAFFFVAALPIYILMISTLAMVLAPW